MKNIFREIKYAYQRVIRGYDERVFWGFDTYFLAVVPALKEFCEIELSGTATKKLNPKRHEIFKHTLKLISDYNIMKDDDWFNVDNSTSKLLEYVGKHIGYFWD